MKSPGSKWKLAARIVGTFPRHRVYVEPFFGSGAVLFRKPRSERETINDLDGEITNLYRVLRDPEARERLVEAVELTPYAEEELRAVLADAEGLDAVERARRLVLVSHMNVGSRTVGAAHFRLGGANSCENSALVWTTLPSRIRAAGERLAGVQVLSRDALRVIRDHHDEDVLIYCDPPYPPSTRSRSGTLYRCEMADWQHGELLAALNEHPGPVVLSSYRSDMYDGALAGWTRIEMAGRSQSRALTMEVLYLNSVAARGGPPVLF